MLTVIIRSQVTPSCFWYTMPSSEAKLTTAISSYPLSIGRDCSFFEANYHHSKNRLRSKDGIANLKLKKSNNIHHLTLVTRASNVSVADASFPADYTELLRQAKEATELAMKDNIQLMEVEFPTSGLQSVPGDGEGGKEMTESMQLIREFCGRLVTPEKAARTRIV